jgi:hypothetical protein
MFMPKKNRIAIYSYLFKGTLRTRPHGGHPKATCRTRSKNTTRRLTSASLVWAPGGAGHGIANRVLLPSTPSPAPSRRPAACPCAEGAITVQKDVRLPEHHVLKVPNVHVVMTLLSLKSRGYVRETFNWCVQHTMAPPPALRRGWTLTGCCSAGNAVYWRGWA